MSTLLHMDASVRADSLSRQLSGRFAERWRSGHPEGTVVQVGPVRIGGPEVVVIGGPCSVESREQLLETAQAVKESMKA